jgi:hypothetical protein
MMIRSIWTVVAVGVVAVVGSPLFATGCKATGVGDPCTPEQEYDPTFNGFDEKEVNVESKSFQCQTRLCLVNHFRGRVSCAYGQDESAAPSNGSKTACTVPGTKDPITGKGTAGSGGAKCQPGETDGSCVLGQCTDRTADKAVYCSCRCANIDGATNDGANYCKCPDGFACTQLVTSIGQGDTGLTGAYCIKTGTEYNLNNSPCALTCDATIPKQNCN